MQEGGKLSQGFACLDLHNPPRISNLPEEVIHHNQKASKGQNTDHEYHLIIIHEHSFQLALENYNKQ